MFDHKVLETLNAQAVAAANVRIEHGGSTLAVTPESCRLTNLEPFQLNRDRFRGQLQTHSLQDFVNYVERHLSGEASLAPAGFIDQDAMSAKVIFNLGTQDYAGHGDDHAVLTLKPTSAYKALCEIVGRGLSQQQLAEWLEDWAPHLLASANGEALNIVAAINAVRRMTIKASSQVDTVVGDFNQSRSAMDEIEAKSLDTLPSQFIFTTRPYEALNPADITLRLSVITGEKAPVLKLRWVGQEAQQEGFADEFKQALVAEVGGLVPMTIGTYTQGK